ncbi:MAG: hypothetical protein ABI670_11585 [Chloroflexota bacterium]
MEDQLNQKDGAKDKQKMQNIKGSKDVEVLLSATVPQVDEYFRKELEERLIGQLTARQVELVELVRQPAGPTKIPTAPERIRRADLPVPILRAPSLAAGAMRRNISRATSFAIGVAGIILLGVLFVLMSAMLGGRHSLSSNPPVQPQSGPYTAYSTDGSGSFHISAIAGYNLLENSKPGKFLFFYAMQSSEQGTPEVTALLQTPTPAPRNKNARDTVAPGKDRTTPSSTAPAAVFIMPTAVPTDTIKVIDIQPLGQIGEFQVGVIYTEWVAPPVGSAFVLLIAPPGGKEAMWRLTPLVDVSASSPGIVTSIFKISPPEMEHVSVACPCGPQAFRLAILGRSTRDAPPIILGVDPYGTPSLLTEAEYFRILSPQGTPFPTEDTEHPYLAPTYPPTSTADPSLPTVNPAQVPLPEPTAQYDQHFFVAMGDGGTGIPAIEPLGTPSGTETNTPRITKADVEQYVSTHAMHGTHVTISYGGNEPSIVGIELVQLAEVYRRYTPDMFQLPLPWPGPYPRETQVYMVTLHGTFRFSGGPPPGELGAYDTGVWVFDANTGYDILEGGVGSTPRKSDSTITPAISPPLSTVQPQVQVR